MQFDTSRDIHDNTQPTDLRGFAAEAVTRRNSGQTEYERYLAMPTAVLHADGVIEIREEISGANQ